METNLPESKAKRITLHVEAAPNSTPIVSKVVELRHHSRFRPTEVEDTPEVLWKQLTDLSELWLNLQSRLSELNSTLALVREQGPPLD